MRTCIGKIIEIQHNSSGGLQAVIALSGGKTPQPGQYYQAHRVKDRGEAIPHTLFPGGILNGELEDAFTTAPPIPDHWQPGDELSLRGPLGKGFSLPNHISRLALASLSDECGHLLPLAAQVLKRGGEVALFTENSYPQLPTQLEISPLAGLEKALLWANFLAVSGSPEQVAALKRDLYPKKMMPCPAQALVLIPMPCGALGGCGVCALPNPKGETLLACEDGPVFEWEHLPDFI